MLDEVATLVVGMREPAEGRARRRPRRRARAVRGRARARQDAGRPEPGDRAGPGRSGGCSARPTCCRRTSPGPACSTRRRRRSRSGPGPVFAGLLLADEINRTAPKTQSALLEAMAERQVTVDGETYPLPDPFHVVATSNPVEYEGTYPLPEAQLDRFMVRLAVGYPERDAEVDVLSRRLGRPPGDGGRCGTVVDAATLLRDAGGRRGRHGRRRRPAVLRRPRRGHPRARRRRGRRVAARLAGAACSSRASLAVLSGPGLRHARGRQGGRRRRRSRTGSR